MNIPHKTQVTVGNVEWYLFSARYYTSSGTFEFYYYAKSLDHAEEVLQELKSTAFLTGQVVDVVLTA